MISWVKRESFAPNELPYKFEAGTPNIADVIATGATLDYIEKKIGMLYAGYTASMKLN